MRDRAAERMKDTAAPPRSSASRRSTASRARPIWHLLYSFPPNDFGEIERGYEEFAERSGPIIDVFDAEGVRFALEVHPTEIAYDFVTTRQGARRDRRTARRSASTSTRATSRISSSTPPQFALEFADRIYHVHVKDSRRRLDGRRSILASHLNFGERGARLGLRLSGPRRRRLRGLLPGAQPDRLPGAALDRVGGQRHGSRLGRAGRARLRPPHGLRAVARSPSTQRCRRRATT